jgi:hypothetical protein
MKAKLLSDGDPNSKYFAVEVRISNLGIATSLTQGTDLRRRASREET